MTPSPRVTEIRPYVSTAVAGKEALRGQGMARLVKPSPLHEGQGNGPVARPARLSLTPYHSARATRKTRQAPPLNLDVLPNVEVLRDRRE